MDKYMRMGKRLALWLLSLLMVIGIINLPVSTTEAKAAGVIVLSVDAKVTEPFDGEVPQTALPQGKDGYKFTDIKWFSVDNPSTEFSGTFQAGKRYIVSLYVEPTVGSKLPSRDLLEVTINGQTATVSSEFTENGGWISYRFPAAKHLVASGDGWMLDSGETLHLTGKITNTSTVGLDRSKTPWFEYKDNIKHVIAHEGSSVNNCSMLFYGHSALVDADISKLDTSSVEQMSQMFIFCKNLESVNLKGLNTSKVENMYDMFEGCSKLESIDLSGLDTSRVETMNDMFYNCVSLKSVKIDGINTAYLYETDYMFGNCKSLVSLDLSGFNTDSLNSSYNMIDGCSGLTEIKIKAGAFYENLAYMLYDGSRIWADKSTGEIYKDQAELQNITGIVTLVKINHKDHTYTNGVCVCGKIADGLAKVSGTWGYYIDGKLQTTKTGIVQKAASTDKTWYFVKMVYL